jgi:hypothetical protein
MRRVKDVQISDLEDTVFVPPRPRGPLCGNPILYGEALRVSADPARTRPQLWYFYPSHQLYNSDIFLILSSDFSHQIIYVMTDEMIFRAASCQITTEPDPNAGRGGFELGFADWVNNMN